MIGNTSEHNETGKPNDFEVERLQQALQDGDVDFTREGYELKILGKSNAKYLTSTKTETVIVPDLEHNSKPENKDSENLYIVGDNLEALKHLLGSYAGKVKCIYIDPPYNTVLKGADGRTSLNFVIETKGVNAQTDLRGSQKLRFKAAKKFFESISDENIDVRFSPQLKHDGIVAMIKRVVAS